MTLPRRPRLATLLIACAVLGGATLGAAPALAQPTIYKDADAPDADSSLAGARLLGPFGVTGEEVIGDLLPRPDADVFDLESPFGDVVLLRAYVADRGSDWGSGTNLFQWGDSGTLWSRWGYLDDNRPMLSWLAHPGEVYSLGVGSTESVYGADSTYLGAGQLGAATPPYAITALAPRRLRGDRVMEVSGEINRLDDPAIQTVGLAGDPAPELILFEQTNDPTTGVDPGEQLRHVVRIGSGLAGCRARVYGTVSAGLVQITPSGTVIEKQWRSQIRWNDHQAEDGFPGVYPLPAINQNGYDPGVYAIMPLQEGNFFAWGLVDGRPNGNVYDPDVGYPQLWQIQTAAPARRGIAYLQFLCPSFAPASPEALTLTETEVRLRWTASRQCAAARVHLATGDSVDVDLGPLGEEHLWWSRSAEEAGVGEAFEARAPLPAPLPLGQPVAWTATPLCAGPHWDREPHAALAFSGQSAVAVAREGGVASSGVALVVAPNPVADAGHVRVSLDRPQRLRASVYDAQGREVAVLHVGLLASGTTSLPLAPARLAPGVYLVRVRGEDGSASRTLTVLR